MIRGFFEFLYYHRDELLKQSLEHLWLTLISLTFSVIVGVSLGLLISKRHKMASPVLWFTNAVQTVPSIALLGVLLPFVGIGALPAIIALFLYGLLPIVRNTYAGITGVDPAIREAATGMGLTEYQVLTRVEIPLATPFIFAGIRTAFVINVGVATLCALIAAGGLGEFIFRGLGTNNSQMILAGAIPAAFMALFFDSLMGYVQKHLSKVMRPFIAIFILLLVVLGLYEMDLFSGGGYQVIGGFPSEFIERGDGYTGLKKKYDLRLDTREMDIGLMYQAVKNKDVDVISGFSTDGRITAFNLYLLKDDKKYFPPYHAAPLIREDILKIHPEIRDALAKVEGRINDSTMARLNYLVDEQKEPIEKVARDYLHSLGLLTDTRLEGKARMVIGSKNFTENYILAEMFHILIENYTSIPVEMKLGFGNTKLLFDALRTGEVDLYPEYTGTGLLVILQPGQAVLDSLKYEKEEVYRYVSQESLKRFNVEWLPPLGFNNTFALMVRKEYAREKNIHTISELARYSRQ